MFSESYRALKNVLSFPKTITILSHRNPDGDALGSSLALSLYLQSKGHKVYVVLPSEYPLNFEWMPQVEEIIVYDLSQNLAEEKIKQAELIFCLDFNSLERIDKMGVMVSSSEATCIMVDHHLEPEPFADIQFSDTSASSTCELIYRILRELEPDKPIAQLQRDCIYTGLMTDTGSFKHGTSSEVFDIMSQLKSWGLEDTRLYNLIMNSHPDKYLKLIGHCLHNRMELLNHLRVGIIHLTRDDYKQFDIQRGDTEGIINYLMMLKNVQVGAIVMHQPSIVKLSLRSKGNISVQEICRDHFNGGGHFNASGGSSKLGMDETLKKLKEVFEEKFGSPKN
ncbi:MAG TPA: bifunctional oligoribonuclease/PAP phosphatase NrnA [Saprospiraceae bacterium]|nr:bifunctional oligoribonuclease/PAP phosphatase NrnA [Saprospiraceae bacterium]